MLPALLVYHNNSLRPDLRHTSPASLPGDSQTVFSAPLDINLPRKSSESFDPIIVSVLGKSAGNATALHDFHGPLHLFLRQLPEVMEGILAADHLVFALSASWSILHEMINVQ